MSDDPPHVVAICGSLREESYTRVGLRHTLSAAEERGATTDHVDLRDLHLPTFNPDEDEPADAAELTRRVGRADAVLLGTPMYHGSYASPLKTALDYCGFDEFEHATVGLLVVSGGAFPTPALEHLRTVCRALNAWVLPHQVAIPRARTQIADGEFRDTDLEERVHTLGRRIVEYAHIEPEPPTFESEENVGG